MPPRPKREKRQETIYLTPIQAEQLGSLAARTRIAKAVLLREAVDDLLAKHEAGPARPKSSKKLPGGKPGK